MGSIESVSCRVLADDSNGQNFVGSKSLEQKELPIELVRRDRLELIKEPVTIRTPEVDQNWCRAWFASNLTGIDLHFITAFSIAETSSRTV